MPAKRPSPSSRVSRIKHARKHFGELGEMNTRLASDANFPTENIDDRNAFFGCEGCAPAYLIAFCCAPATSPRPRGRARSACAHGPRGRRTSRGDREWTRRVVANFWQMLGKISFVFGCIGTDPCKQIRVFQNFSKSSRLSS